MKMDPPDSSTILYSVSINDDFPAPVLRNRKLTGQSAITHILPSNDTNPLAALDGHRYSVEHTWQARAVAHLDVPEFNGTDVWPSWWRPFGWQFMSCFLRNGVFPCVLHNCLRVNTQ